MINKLLTNGGLALKALIIAIRGWHIIYILNSILDLDYFTRSNK